MLVAAYGYENVLFWHLEARPDEGLQVGLESTQYISLHGVSIYKIYMTPYVKKKSNLNQTNLN